MCDLLSTLSDLGWDLPEPNSDGIMMVWQPDLREVSFPAESYEKGNNSETGFWVDHRAEAILDITKRLGIRELVEVGAGNGNISIPLVKAGVDVLAIEPIPSGVRAMHENGVTAICGLIDDVQFPSNSISNYGIFDVLEHLENPEAVLDEIHRTLKIGGFLLVTVPAGQWLWGTVDEALGHYRRYSRKSLAEQLGRTGFRIVENRYLFACLVPIAFLVRALPYRLHFRRSKQASLRLTNRRLQSRGQITKMIIKLLKLERFLSSFCSLPYGLSIVVVAIKQ